MSRTYRTINRLLGILDHIEAARRSLSVREVYDFLKEAHPADERTYRRDLENLEYLGFLNAEINPDDRTEPTRYRTHRMIKAGRALTVGLKELLALYVAKGMLAPLEQTPLFADLEKLFQRIEATLGPKARDYLAELSQEVVFDPGPKWGLGISAELIETVEHACAEGQVLEATYDSVHSGEKRQRRLGPQFLYFAKGSMYLVAEDLEDSVIKTFALPRLSKPKILDQSYSGEKIDPDTFFSSSMSVFRGPAAQVELRFKRPQAKFVAERRWYASQHTFWNEDGTLLMRLQVALSPELTTWVLGFGAAVEVLKPAELRTAVKQAAQAIADQYKSKKKAA
jgi:predicted DNA-binding transcriptional regulator YafY